MRKFILNGFKSRQSSTKQPDIDLKHSTLNILFYSKSNEMMFLDIVSIDRKHRKGKEKREENQ